jgi:hypothetical protein
MGLQHKHEPESEADPIGEYWTDVRPKGRTRRKRPVVRYDPPTIEAFIEWVVTFSEPGHTSIRVLPGASPQERLEFLQGYLAPTYDRFRPDCIEDLTGAHTRNWVEDGVLINFTERMEAQPLALDIPKDMGKVAPRWQLLWGLILAPDFVVGDPLKGLVDQEYSMLHNIYKVLWEARFLAREETSQEKLVAFVTTILRWITDQPLTNEDAETLLILGARKRVESVSERVDALLFLISLAAQNALLTRATFFFDDLERALLPDRHNTLRQLDEFLMNVDRWATKLDCPIGVLIGFQANKQTMRALRRRNPKLYKRIETGLSWT